MGYYPYIEWNDEANLNTKVKALYNIVNWLSKEMGTGRVPNNKVDLHNEIVSSEERTTSPLSITFVKMVENGEIDEITASENANLFVPWDAVSNYVVNEYREFQGKLYKCLQAHTGQEDWTPDVAPALWKLIGLDENGIVEWSQPISAADAYNIGDVVLYNGIYYRSTIDGNVWAPDAYPAGWEVYELPSDLVE